MALDFATLDVRQVIVHEVPIRRADNGTLPVLSEVASPLTDELRLYIKEKITQSACSSCAFKVSLDLSSSSPVPQGITRFLDSDGMDFVTFSQRIADHLFQTQTGVNSKGLITVVDCAIGGMPAVGILKLEREIGVRVEQSNIDGRKTFRIEHIRELMLTQGTKVFKAGVFLHHGPGVEDIDGVVSDHQRGRLPRYEIADFFLKKFLGCQLAEAAEVTTKRFLDAAEDFINDVVSDPLRKGRYQTALLAEMNSNQATLNPKQFANTHLETEDRQLFIDHLKSSQVANEAIDKDLGLIRTRIQRMQMDFETGISITAPGEVFSNKVHLIEQDGGLTKVEFEDRLRNVRGRR
ncbi:MAG: nucleoid-associated protein [Chloroflexi bacterium]|nr:nucleoid-associated protein [Chloroflexota bacterium]